MIGTRLPAWRHALAQLSEQLVPGEHERDVVEPVERIAPDTLAARIGAQPLREQTAMSSGNAPWRRALLDR